MKGRIPVKPDTAPGLLALPPRHTCLIAPIFVATDVRARHHQPVHNQGDTAALNKIPSFKVGPATWSDQDLKYKLPGFLSRPSRRARVPDYVEVYHSR